MIRSVAVTDAAGEPMLRLPDDARSLGNYIAPLALIRSALFAVVKKGKRRMLQNEALAAHPGTVIKFNGEQLDQSDEDVFLELVESSAERDFGTKVEFSLSGILNKLEWDRSGRSAERLKSSFTRLLQGTVELSSKNYSYRGHLVDAIRIDRAKDKTGSDAYWFRLNPELLLLFQEHDYVRIAIADRKKLSRMLSKWLHSYLESRSEHVVSTTVAEIMTLSGSASETDKSARSSVLRAVTELKDAGVIEDFRFERSMVFITKLRRTQKALNR